MAFHTLFKLKNKYIVVMIKEKDLNVIASSNFLYVIKKDNIIEELYETLGENYINQFNLDFPRMEILYNSIKCDRSLFFENILRYKNIFHPFLNNLMNLIIMLSTQASFFYLFKYLHDIYTISDSNLYITQNNDYPIINIIDKIDKIFIIYRKTFLYTNLEKNITKINGYMIINFDICNTSNGYLMYGKKYCKYKNCIIYWIKEKNLLII